MYTICVNPWGKDCILYDLSYIIISSYSIYFKQYTIQLTDFKYVSYTMFAVDNK